MISIVHDKILDFSGEAKVPCVVVGQKCDLAEQSANTLNRQVDPAEAQKLAQSINAMFIETSARTNTNVAKVFDLLLGEIEGTPTKQTLHNDGNKCSIM